jgi:NADH dehydrogenase FAD-containing subunit
MSSSVKQISAKHVQVEHQGELLTLSNNAVIVCAGGVLPTPFLKKIGIEVSTKYGTE